MLDLEAILEGKTESDIDFYEIEKVQDERLAKVYQEIKIQVIDIVVDSASIYEATEFTKKLRSLKKQVDEARKESIVDLKNQIKEREEPYKNWLQEIEKLEKTLREKILGYQSEERKRQQEVLEKQRQLQIEEMREQQERYAEKGDEKSSVAVGKTIEKIENEEIKTKSVIKGLGTTSSVRDVMKYEIIDADKVPRRYCEPSKSLLWKAIQSGITEIAGVKIWKEEILAIR